MRFCLIASFFITQTTMFCNPLDPIQKLVYETLEYVLRISRNNDKKYRSHHTNIWKNRTVQELIKSKNSPKNVIFDMSGVLIDLHEASMGLSKVGMWKMTQYLVTHRRSQEYIKNGVLELYTTDNHAVSNLIAAFQAGQLSPEDCVKIITQKSKTLYHQNHYKSREEKDIILALASIPFDASCFAEHTSLIKDGVKLLKACVKAGHTIIILSNWDKHSFELINKKYHHDLFQYIDPQNIYISGETHALKPSCNAYNYVLAALPGNQIGNCILFDAYEEHIAGAQACQIMGILCKLG